ncbi:hypothetical protein HN924_02495 [Candidatus Woesearchaeota archaeon]|jgi:hypothetical protein|nr:hypothetical protein [Candidatus Woesearchaeota archaeon]MBT7062814.1 hypothetical protein [Candidatus Woesearchaeota archaeon]MBT7402842.1 hypothetical protein [Candidatus Woesearchaeota archaeon]
MIEPSENTQYAINRIVNYTARAPDRADDLAELMKIKVELLFDLPIEEVFSIEHKDEI